MHWKAGKEKGQHQHNIQGTDAFFRAVLIPTLKGSLSQCFLHLQALQSPASGGLSPFASVPTQPLLSVWSLEFTRLGGNQ